MAIAVGSSVAPTPGVSSFATLKKRVIQYVQGPNDPELLEMAGDCINEAIEKLATRTWNWSLIYQDISTAADTLSYSVSDNYKKPRMAHLLDSSSNENGRLHFQDEKRFWDVHRDRTSTGSPCFYTVHSRVSSGKLELSTKPSSGWVSLHPTIRFRYFATVSTLTSDGASPAVPPEFEPFLIWYARWSLAAIRGVQVGFVDRAFATWKELWRDLVADDNNVLTDWEV